jgi:CBS domain-containing protein
MDPNTVTLGEIMTREPRLAREDDQMLDWLRIMSNERFRRLPVVDDDGRIKAIFTQGDFVSYTWPDLFDQAKNLAKASVIGRFHYFLIGGGILIYVLAMIVVLVSL